MRKRRRGSVRTRRAGGAEPAQIRATVLVIDSVSSNAESHRQWAVRGTRRIAAATGTATAQEEVRDSAPTVVVEAAPTGLLDAVMVAAGTMTVVATAVAVATAGAVVEVVAAAHTALQVAAANVIPASQGEAIVVGGEDLLFSSS